MRCREIKGQPVVYGRALGVREGQVVRVARIQAVPEPGLDEWTQVLAADAYDAYRGAAGGRGDSQNWVVVAGEHGLGLFADAPIICAPRAVAQASRLQTNKAACAALWHLALAVRLSELGQIKFRRHAHAGVNNPLLRNRQNVVGNPVQHQTRGEKEEHHAKDQRHHPHQFGLHGVRWRRVEGGLNQRGQGHHNG